MASSRDTSNGPDWTDILNTLKEMEGDLDCRIVLTMRVLAQKGEKVLRVQAEAFPQYSPFREALPSVSLSATLDRAGSGLGVAAIYRLLLAVDYEASKKWAVKQT